MIILNTDSYILVCEQETNFGGGRLFQSAKEVFEQFCEWAEADEMEDPKLTGYTFADLIEIWAINIMKYDGKDFQELTADELNTKNI